MINIIDKSSCCGCAACSQRCPQQCVSMVEDGHGFQYPETDIDNCVDCGLCETVCPKLNSFKPNDPIVAYAAWHQDKMTRINSSSGGVFTALAEFIIKQGGVVFGVRFTEKWEVVHDYTEKLDELVVFTGSKYVQSHINDNFTKAEQFLKQGRQVLFTGTPCQIAGLKLFLLKEYENLLAVEIACHGVPSPLVWREYIKGINPTTINFRDKRTGWKNYSVLIGSKTKPHDKDIFMYLFLANYTLRPSCFSCVDKNGKSKADITIADLWGCEQIVPEMDDDCGTSAVIAWTKKGSSTIGTLNLQKQKVDYRRIIRYNPSIVASPIKPNEYDGFWQQFQLNPLKTIKETSKRHLPSVTKRIKGLIIRIFSK